MRALILIEQNNNKILKIIPKASLRHGNLGLCHVTIFMT